MDHSFIFTTAHVRQCAPHLGTAVLQLWEKKGWISYKVIPRSGRSLVRFNAPGIVDALVVAQMAIFGVNQAGDVKIYLDRGGQDIKESALDRPDDRIALYEDLAFDAAVYIHTTNEQRDFSRNPRHGKKGASDPRTSRGYVASQVVISPRNKAPGWFKDWYDDPMLGKYLTNAAFVCVYSTMRHVCRTLNIEEPPPRQQQAPEGFRGTIPVTPKDGTGGR